MTSFFNFASLVKWIIGGAGTISPVGYVMASSPYYESMWKRKLNLIDPVIFKCAEIGGGGVLRFF